MSETSLDAVEADEAATPLVRYTSAVLLTEKARVEDMLFNVLQRFIVQVFSCVNKKVQKTVN